MGKSQEIKNLEEKIKDLKREAEYKEKEMELEKERIRLDVEKNWRELEARWLEEKVTAEAEAEKQRGICKEMEKRYDDGAYKQLSDILKALVVKLPTMNIKDLSVISKGKS